MWSGEGRGRGKDVHEKIATGMTDRAITSENFALFNRFMVELEFELPAVTFSFVSLQIFFDFVGFTHSDSMI